MIYSDRRQQQHDQSMQYIKPVISTVGSMSEPLVEKEQFLLPSEVLYLFPEKITPTTHTGHPSGNRAAFTVIQFKVGSKSCAEVVQWS